MKPHRPAPRTLASPPRTPLRSPQAAVCEARFPSLAMVLAAGAALPACNAPVCGDTRADELTRHGAEAVAQARGGHVAQGLHEIGVALGLAKHARTTAPSVPTPEMPNAGAPPPMNVTPPTQVLPPDEPTMPLGGAPVAIGPVPTPPPPAQNPTRARPHATPTPAPMPRNPGAPRVVAPPPTTTNPEPQLEGDVVRVSPLPTSLTTRRG